MAGNQPIRPTSCDRARDTAWRDFGMVVGCHPVHEMAVGVVLIMSM